MFERQSICEDDIHTHSQLIQYPPTKATNFPVPDIYCGNPRKAQSEENPKRGTLSWEEFLEDNLRTANLNMKCCPPVARKINQKPYM
jgi:hypothetical protein